MKRLTLLLNSLILAIATCSAVHTPWSKATAKAVEDAISKGSIPGAVVCYIENDQIVFLQAYGHRSLVPDKESMTVNTVFDMASVSKPVGAGTAAMNLIRAGRLNANDPVNKYLPNFATNATIEQLMHHTSGLPSYMYVARLDSTYKARISSGETTLSRPDFLVDTICRCARPSKPGETYRYSCLNFITLQRVVETITGEPLNRIRPFYRPTDTDAQSIGNSAPRGLEMIAPTEQQPDGSVLRGDVHDPLARVFMLGISGNAGVFMTAEQLAEWCIWMMNIPKEEREKGLNAGLWTDDDGSLNHTGYTGTSIRLYPDEHKALIVLTNRVHPKDVSGIGELRAALKKVFFK